MFGRAAPCRACHALLHNLQARGCEAACAQHRCAVAATALRYARASLTGCSCCSLFRAQGTLVLRKRYRRVDYVAAVGVAVGCAFFATSGMGVATRLPAGEAGAADAGGALPLRTGLATALPLAMLLGAQTAAASLLS